MKQTNIQFWSYLAQFFLEWEDVSEEICKKKQNTYFTFIFFFENRAAYDITWKNTVQPDRPQMENWHMPIVCWIPKIQTHIQNM
jgi:hypothetical protein